MYSCTTHAAQISRQDIVFMSAANANLSARSIRLQDKDCQSDIYICFTSPSNIKKSDFRLITKGMMILNNNTCVSHQYFASKNVGSNMCKITKMAVLGAQNYNSFSDIKEGKKCQSWIFPTNFIYQKYRGK